MSRYRKAIAVALVPVAIVVAAYLSTGHVSQEQLNAALIALLGIPAVFFAKNAAEPKA